MANGLSKLIKRARKANENNILAKLARNRFRVEELEDRIAPAVTVMNGAANNNDGTYTLDADGEYLQFTDSNGETWEIGMLQSGSTNGDIVITFNADNGDTLTDIDMGSTAALEGTYVKLVIGDDGGTNGGNDLSLGDIIDTQANTATGISIYGVADTDFTDGITDTVDATTSALIDYTSANLGGSDVDTISVDAAGGTTTVNTLTGSFTAATSLGNLTIADTLSGDVTSAGTIGTLTVTTGNATGDITAAGNVTSVVIDNGNLAGTITTTGTANLATLNVDGDISGAVTVAGTLGGTLFDADGDISSAVSANAIGNTGFSDLTSAGSISSTTTIGTVTADNGIAGSITAGTTITGVTITSGDLDGSVEAAGDITNITVDNGDLTGTVTTTGTASLATLNVDGNISGAVTVAGTLGGTLFDADGDISSAISAGVIGDAGFSDLTSAGSITSAAGIGTVTADDGIAGNITAATTITGISITSGNLTGGISAGGNITAITVDNGDITTTGSITTTGTANLETLNVDGDIAGAVTVAGTLGGTLFDADGDISSAISAGVIGNAGFSDLTATGSITSSGAIGTVTADDNIAGTITAAGAITAIVTTDGSISGSITTTGTGNGIGAITVDAGGSAGSITSTAVITSAEDIGAITVGLDMAGTITAAVDATGNITADDISGTITVRGNLLASVTATDATDGSIDNLIVDGSIDASNGAITISAAGGDVTVSSNAITTGDDGGENITISATGNVTVSTGTITYGTANTTDITMTADAGVSDNNGDLSLTTTGDVSYTTLADGKVDFDGENITLNLGTDATTASPATINLNGGASVITAANDLTIAAITGDLSADTLKATAGSISAITTTGDLVIGTQLQATGTDASIGAITAGGDLTLTDVDADLNIGAITATGSITVAASGIVTANGSIGAITAGDADNVTSDITMTGSIVAATTIGAVSASQAIDGAGTITAGAQVADANGIVLSVTDSSVVYTLESDNAAATDVFNLMFDFDAQNDLTITTLTRTTDTAINLSLKTANTDGTVVDTEFDLVSFAFADASITAGYNQIGTLTVDGDIQTAVTLGSGSAADAVLIQGDLAGMFRADSLNVFAATRVGGAVATTSLLDDFTSKAAGTADPVATPIDGTFVLPVDPTDDIIIMGVDANGDAFGVVNALTVSVGNANDNEATVAFSAGAFSSMSGADGGAQITGDIADLDLSTITGALSITGDISGTLTLADTGLSSVTITGAVAPTAAITIGDVAGTVSIGVGSAVEGTITVGDISGGGQNLLLGDLTGATVTVGDVPNDVVIDSIDVASTITIGDVTNDVTIGADMLGSLNIGDMAAGALVVTGNFGSVISIDGDVASITLNDLEGDGIIGSATSTITVTGKIVGNLNVNDDGGVLDTITELTVLADITLGDGHLTMVNGGADNDTIAYTGAISLGATGDAGDGTTGNITIDGTAFVTVTALDAAVFADASYDATDGQLITVSDVVLYDAGNGGAEAINIDSASVGTIYAGNVAGGLDVAITIDDPSTAAANDGTLAAVVIDDDADLSALGLTADGALLDSFDNGLTEATTANPFAITAASIGSIFVEGAMTFNAITATTGDLGTITAGGAITAAAPSNAVADITATAGNVGLIVAEGAISADITIDEGYTFDGMITTNGAYTGDFNVEATVGQILLTGAFNDTLGTFDTDDVAMFSAGDDFAVEGYSSLEGVTVVGPTVLLTENAGDVTIAGLTSTSVVTIDETDGDILTDDLIIDGDLAGTVTITELSTGSDIDDLTVQGDWTGTLAFARSVSYDSTVSNIGTITVWGSVATATLTGATFTNAVDYNGDAIDDTVDEVASKTVYQVPNSDQYIYLTGGSVTADISTLFGQVTGFELEGKGGVKIVTIESATTPDDSDMLKAAKYGKKMIKGNEVANDFIDFDAPGDANLPAIVVGPAVQINSLVVDGDVGAITDVDSNIKNVFVSGTAGDIFAGKNLINGYFGNAGDIKAVKVSDLHVEGNVTGDIVGEKLKDIDIEGNVTTLASDVITNASVGGNVTNLMAAKINKTYTAGTIANLHIQRDFKGRPGKISNSVLYDIALHNIDFNATVGSGGASDVIVDNPDYNPVKIVNSFVEL